MADGKRPLDRRRAARFAAIQALYQIDVTGRSAVDVVAEFERHRLDDLFVRDETGSQSRAVDRDLFQDIVMGVAARQEELDPVISAHLAPGWSLRRCGYTLRAMLRAGAWELKMRPTTPIGAIISEYVELARGFFEGKEPGFVHAVLDHAAPTLRQAPTSLADLVDPDRR
ncbi:MAG: transcription antitermination factor NusB [Pseudomonadota bacterium]